MITKWNAENLISAVMSLHKVDMKRELLKIMDYLIIANLNSKSNFMFEISNSITENNRATPL